MESRAGERAGRCAISAGGAGGAGREAQARGFADAYIAEDRLLETAREHAAEIGLAAVCPATGAALRLMAAAGSARAVVEIGTGTGVSGLWLLRGMRPDGVLTTIDVEAEHQRVARRLFAAAGLPPSRTRIITGRAADVLPRLADRAYDLIFVHHDRLEFAASVKAAARLLRPGGMLVLGGAWGGGRITDPTARDPESVALREILKTLRDDEGWLSAFLPTGDGLLCSVRRA